MTQPDIIQTILKDSNYHLDLFTDPEVQSLRQKIFIKTVRSKETPHIKCIIRNNEIQLKPEELIRQLYAARLLNRYHYSPDRVRFEHLVNFGRERKRADIVILDKDRPDAPYIIIEIKKPKLQDGKEQLRSYCNATGAPIAVWTNGQQISHYHRKDPNYFEEITDIPTAEQELGDLLKEDFTLTLSVLLKSSVGQLQLKKGCSGTILTAINRDVFSRIVAPIIKEDKQTEIQQKVIESFNLRKQAKDLLEHAKRAVEIAIEQDEATAINWLESVSQLP